MRKSKLGRRIWSAMLAAAFIMGLIVCGVGYGQILRFYKTAADEERTLGETATDQAQTALLSQAEASMDYTVKQLAESRNMIFQRTASEAETLSKSLTTLMKSGASVGDMPQDPRETENGVLMGRGLAVFGVEMTAELENEMKTVTSIESQAASVFTDSGWLRSIIIGTESGLFYRYSNYNDYSDTYDHRMRDWYKKAVASPDNAVWSDAYTEAYGNQVVTCSMTFRGADGEIAGVVSLDLLLDDLLKDLSAKSTLEGSYGFLLDRSGKLVAETDVSTGASSTSDGSGSESSCYDEVLRVMTSGESGLTTITYGDKSAVLGYAPIKENGWSLGLVVPYDTITGPLNSIRESISELEKEIESDTRSARGKMNIQMIICYLLVHIPIGLMAYALARLIVLPIKQLNEGAKRIGNGELNTKIAVKGDDEIAELGRTFNQMAGDLQNYIDNLSIAIEERHRVSAELNIATHIQEDMLPSIFPAYPMDKRFDVYASMVPAKEVGGDFYDFFMIDDRRMALVIADVSGKGIGAALFMVIAKTLIKNEAQTERSVAKIMQKVNDQLSQNNSAEMFVTAWVGIIDIETGKMVCSNAGHEYPLVRKSNGKFEYLQDKHSFVLAGMEGTRYKEYELEVEPGGTILLYTDGITEANNEDQKMFGMDRLLDAVNIEPNAAPKTIIEHVSTAVATFRGEASQFDDMTMLCWKRCIRGTDQTDQ